MKRRLVIFGAISLSLVAYACGSTSNDAATTDGTTPSTPGSGETPSGPAPTGTSTSAPPAKANPISGIAAAKIALQADAFTDGPVWHAGLGALFFTTPLGDGAIYQLKDGVASMIRGGSSADGTTPIASVVLASGDLVTAEAKCVVRTKLAGDGGGAPTVIAAGFAAEGGLVAFDTLNDVVARRDGTLYVTDPGYFADPTANRIYRIAPSGAVQVVESFADVPRPNGIALSPDEKTLYLGFTSPMKGLLPGVRRYPVNADGTLGASEAFVDIGPADSSPDGLTVDSDGNVYVAAKNGIHVFAADATKVGVVAVPEAPTGLAFGGADMKSLFVTTQGSRIWEIRINVAGLAQ